MTSTANIAIEIQSIDDLITALSEEERTEFNHIIRSVNLPAKAFEDYSSWSSECYTRNCILDNEQFELILICWGGGQRTPIHDHGGEECWVKVIEGKFKECIYNEKEDGELEVVKSSIVDVNEVSYMIDFMGFHSLENLSDERSMSLHLYAKPIRSCRAFDEESKSFVQKNLSYHTKA